MNNTEKKLDALIDALGFDVLVGEVMPGDLIDRSYSSASYSTKEINKLYPNKHIKTESFGGNWIVSEPIIDYKVTKRKPIKRLDVPLCKKSDGLVTCDECNGSGNYMALKCTGLCMKCKGVGKVVPSKGVDRRILDRQCKRDFITNTLKHDILTTLKKSGKEPKKSTRLIIFQHIDNAVRNL